ncbi:YqgE/AlgH family protein [Methylomarinum sp. Ch1-1]|uniref:UPF0301 protein Q9L42_006165 n=1 Tax=Methylomarinum roseum TaxID=3067653 RepID=A0AAU7NXF4_9GAMM|nr:YqgE/AlgH family protein [Methylomarinum sp. Ch1-1]MDP4522198.1 YqgE/AlgH family protein [Methylomarinum sp. Ch1-1]
MTTANYLNNQFLIAMPNLTDPSFSHTVTYLCQHNEEGALGIVINRSAGLTLSDIFEQMKINSSDEQINETPILIGGPVQQDRGFVLHSYRDQSWDSTVATSDTTALTSSRDILEAIAAGEGPDHFLIALGYAGWGSGQLEKEIIDNAWLNTPCGENILYDMPINQRWNAAASQLGVDINKLTAPAGHA